MSERIVAVIPVRSLREGKTRLAPLLSPEQRQELLRRIAERVVHAARNSGAVETVLVVSPDSHALAWARELGHGVIALPQTARSEGLNGAIDAGRAWTREHGAQSILSLFADLPLLAPDDVRQLVARPQDVVLGPDRRGEGTNALLLRLGGAADSFCFAFGEGSLLRHLDEARCLDLDVALYEALGVGFDLDTPDDLAEYLRLAETGTADGLPETSKSEDFILTRCGAGAG
jgi:2-phospho-L-lactate guanylyltransferase